MEWIKVEDRQPEDKGDYLVTDGFACFVAMYEFDNCWNFFGNKHWNSEDVTHWMPLPEPPKP